MSKFDELKESLAKSAEKAKEAAAEAGTKLKETDYKELAQKTQDSLKSTAENVQTSIRNFDADSAKEDISNMAKKGTDSLKRYLQNSKETDSKVRRVLEENEREDEKLLPEDALKIIYLLMLSDKAVSDEENARFDHVVSELDVENSCDKTAIVDNCCAIVASSNSDDYLDFITDGIQDALHHSRLSGKGTIDKKLLLWDLLAVAYSDGEYSESEKAVLRVINRRMEIDPSIILEMETAVSTIDALARQEDELRQSNRSYAEIDRCLKEIEYRKNVIMQSVQELLED